MRQTTTESREIGISLDSVPEPRREIAQKILDAFSAVGFGQIQQVAALANAIAESGLDPGARVQNDTGLFLLNRAGGLGTGMTVEELMNPETNINLVVDAARRVPAFEKATSLEDAVAVFVRMIARPTDPSGEIEKRTRIARQILPS
jgi:hypothetical protein